MCKDEKLTIGPVDVSARVIFGTLVVRISTRMMCVARRAIGAISVTVAR